MGINFIGDPTADTGLTFPEGNYFLTCVGVQDADKDGNQLRSKKGYDMFVLELVVTTGPQEGKRIWHYLPFIPAIPGTNNGHGMTLRTLKAFGVPFDGSKLIEPSDFTDKVVHAHVVVEQNDPKYDPKNVIKKFLTVDDPSKVPPPHQAEPQGDGTDFSPEALEEQERQAAAAKPPAQAAPAKPTPAAAGAGKPAVPTQRAKAPWRR